MESMDGKGNLLQHVDIIIKHGKRYK